MHNDQTIHNDGMRWLFGAGLFAVLLCVFLYWADYYLRHSRQEAVLGETLRELRGAQNSLPGHVTDARQLELITSKDERH
ncbi:MAG: hypothetical protein DCC75_12635 [Proteobacteria bacterium]|nr:MAG: hypothetical protein DCC75_12635 [Pseudomonadota bacterium]